MSSIPSQPGRAEEHPSGWRQKMRRELTAYWINVAYLACFFGVFAWYRRLVLAEYDIGYGRYGIALVKALILAKVLLLGDAMRLGKRTEEKPLAYTTLAKTAVFGIWVAAFEVMERTLTAALHGKGLEGGVIELRSLGLDELSAASLVTICALVPFFAFRELSRALGPGKIAALFFHESAGAAPKSQGAA